MAKPAKKSLQTSTPAHPTLGNKRQCQSCGTKFYDFAKEEITCPKCHKKVDINATYTPKAEKKSRAVEPEEDDPIVVDPEETEVVVSTEFESLEDLEDEAGNSIVKKIDVEDDDGDDF